jgi:uncharacterized protein (DUF1501 family)
MTGGNDSLSTVVPFADDAYHAARPTMALPTDEVLKIDDYVGFHPALPRLRDAYESGHVAVVQGVGYPEFTRSHFKSMDIWHTADARGRAAGEGWISRLARHAFEGEDASAQIIHVGPNVPYSLYSTDHPPLSFTLPRAYRWMGDEAQTAAFERLRTEERPESKIDHIRNTLTESLASSARVRRATSTYRTRVEYPPTTLGTGLRHIAALINSRVGSRVLSIEHPGYDTHTRQNNKHNNLMRHLDAALNAFLEDLGRSEAGRNTIVLAFTEFGRRVAESKGQGTDHGVASVAFVLGPTIRGGLYGEYPSLTDLVGGDLRHTTDFRSVYATVIERWFGVEAGRVLGEPHTPLEFI